ncbi:hypothetical protein BJX64DRAFT_293150 [Aspergillus heterothallicus]
MKVKQEREDESLSTEFQDSKETKSTPVKQAASTSARGSDTGTPTSRKRARKTDTATPSATPTKRTKKASGDATTATPRKASLPPVPASLAEAGTEDKMILRMRDSEGKSWVEITKLFISLTGIQVGDSTLRLRYASMKAKFVEIPEEDATRLLRFKKDTEDKFETEKWARIQEAIVANGGGKYPVAALQKKFKQLNKAGVTAASVGSIAATKEADLGENGAEEGAGVDGEE